MKLPLFGRLAMVGAALLLSFSACAALVERDLWDSGDGLITSDGLSGLDWLDVTATLNQSWNAVENRLVAGGDLNGFRLATIQELSQFLDHAGIIYSNFTPADWGEKQHMISLFSLIGATNPELHTTEARYDAPTQFGNTHNIWKLQYSPNGQATSSHDNGYTPDSPSTGDLRRGSFLVRTSAIPIPTTAWLFGSALAGLLVARRKKASGV